eukprot:TRINITY_DN19655_c0_g1_i1.p1 TRINITY_DN19655_c0_g1~~TRINITY_DN19655_c0_g1_i1.p1  ORF type:complete len:746 (-),score=155.43 TRINITY_DN19655_c0_g1_i1:93-2330(-)
MHPVLAKAVEETICPGTGCSPAYVWATLEGVTAELRPEVERCLAQRDEYQRQIDDFYKNIQSQKKDPADADHRPACKEFLHKIGYVRPDQGQVSVTTQFVDPEIAQIPAPQLVVPSDNARYVLNAVNSRWGSLFDALYGFDVIPETAVQADKKVSSGYNPVRGEAVIEFANGLLDEIAPLATGKWNEVTRLWPKFVGNSQQLELLLKNGATTSLRTPSLFVGSEGHLGPPAPTKAPSGTPPSVQDKGRIFLKHNGLHLILEIDREDRIGKSSLSGIKDITMESALTAILDMEDSVAAVDAEDKTKVYLNINGVFRGALSAPFIKNGKAFTRTMNNDISLRDEHGLSKKLPGRVICLVRNVGHHMFTDAVLTADGLPVPEGFLDCVMTVLSGFHDLRSTGTMCNSRTGSLYIVKPKQHGPDEVALTCRLFGRLEECFGMRRNTIKMGIMDEERRTSVNLRECLRVAAERVFFINTGFLDRTGDEIHTCMHAAAVVRKADIKKEPWIKAYEDSNVDVGLFSGLQGKGQIGKGMWAKPDSMKAMLESKISEVMAGASTAWVPSPSAGTLHAIHYHRVDVLARQMQLAMRPQARLEELMTPPLMKGSLSRDDIMHELRENAQSILGYVVRWVDLGVGCSKVPDLSNVGLMEDRATLRISSQLMANWLRHGLITQADLRSTFEDMARLVDQQNSRDGAYQPMAPNFDTNVAFQAALKLVIEGEKAPNGYTEYTLHAARREAKRLQQRSRL